MCSRVVRLDFCLWGPPTLNDIADAEGEVVAYCTKAGHGTRIMPDGTITGMQLLFDGEAYMMTGLLDQTKIKNWSLWDLCMVMKDKGLIVRFPSRENKVHIADRV